jgi:hypothetical protein
LRFLLLLVLLAAGGGYLWYQRGHNYPLRDITTSEGKKYEVVQLPEDCQNMQVCLKRLAYLSSAADTTLLKDEAAGLLPWVEVNVAPGSGPHAIMLIAIKPGFMRLKPPTSMIGVGFSKSRSSGWRYLGQEDMTSRMTSMLQEN